MRCRFSRKTCASCCETLSVVAVSVVSGRHSSTLQVTGSEEEATVTHNTSNACFKMSEELGKGRCTFWMQIGFMREQVVCETDIALPALKELACQFVDRKVSSDFQAFGNDFSWTSFLVLAIVLTVCVATPRHFQLTQMIHFMARNFIS